MSNMVVRTNVLALNSHRNLGNVANNQARSSSRLSSGFRINSAADDAAGLAISENMRAQIRGLDQASRNAQDGISVLQTADGVLATVREMAQRIRELAVQGSNDTYNDDNRGRIEQEMQSLVDEIEDTLDRARFGANDEGLLFSTGSAAAGGMLGGGDFFLQVGANSDEAMTINIATEVGQLFTDLAALDTALTGSLDSHSDFTSLLDGAIQDLLDSVADLATEIGVFQNRLEFTIQNVDIASENLSAAESRIRDADMAKEMMRLTQSNVLQQAATSMLAQANQAPQSVLQLLG